jgi:hypothetical protein
VTSFQKPIVSVDLAIIEYPKREKDWEPPPNINGYQRDTKNRWLFRRVWVSCSHRAETIVRKICGAVNVLAICCCPECPAYQKKVKVADCKNCPFNK